MASGMDRYLAPTQILILALSLLLGVGITLLLDRSPGDPNNKKSASIGHLKLIKSAIGALAVFGIVLLVARATFGSLIIATPFACFFSATPTLITNARRRREESSITQSWPDAIDHLSSAIRAGMNLSESLSAIGLRGPVPLRPLFIALGNDLATSMSLEESLARFCQACDDPIANQLVETVLIAHEVGGSEIGKLLRTFSQFLRLELQTREEIRVRQGWVVNGARIAVAAPWLLLALLSLRHESVIAFESPDGMLVIFSGAVLSVIAYLWMRRLGHLGQVAT